MLVLKNIIKDYVTGDTTVRAMKDISINFRENEFVAILGPSGCGKTTMLNVIGGLDQYTSGDLIINGKSTKEFKDEDWDTYRNHSIGFVFQSYNLISHQSVLTNVELALTLSGVSAQERKQRAIEALAKVGLAGQENKKPAQMSGGQMQRVAIARALINNPDIILADEPTGALDSETSVQIMELLKEVARDKLVIMVTHNPDLANQYANRIISCLDGQVVDDTNPFNPTDEDRTNEKEKREAEKAKGKKPSMSLSTAFMLSVKNLITKRTRTILTAFAGSIGIIGIALILSLSNGINGYIDKAESDALLLFPMTIEQESVNSDSMMENLMSGLTALQKVDHERDKVYVNTTFTEMMNSFIQQRQSNNISNFKKYIDDNQDKFNETCNAIMYKYSCPLNIYLDDGKDDTLVKVNPNNIIDAMGMNDQMSGIEGFVDLDSYTNLWTELIGDNDTIKEHYTTIYGRLPESFNEVVLIVDGNNEITELMLYALGLKDQANYQSELMNVISGETINEGITTTYSYEDICNLKYKLLLNCEMMAKDEKTGLWNDMSSNSIYIQNLLKEKGTDISIVGIIRPNDDNILSVGTGTIGYTKALVDYAMNTTMDSEVVKAQLADTTRDVITGNEFVTMTVNDFDLADIDLEAIDYTKLDITPFLSMAKDMDLSQIDIMDMSSMFNFNGMTDLQKKLMEGYLTDEQVLAFKQAYLDTLNEQSSLENTLSTIGYNDPDEPTSIQFYPKDFDQKQELNNMIAFYNEKVAADGHEEMQIEPTDYIGVLLNLAMQVINIVTYTLIIFVGISLVVSSIMIGIITYVSVIERTKEIGILRAIGASKRDISNVFNAETFMIGLSAGLIGVFATVLMDIPINILMRHLTGAPVNAMLPFGNGLILVIISVSLTLLAGLVPARLAARKDPVECLRTE